MDPSSGELTYAATVGGPGTLNPSFLTVGPDKRTLYAVNEVTGGKGPHGTLSAFAIDPVTKGLRYLNQQSTHGLAPCYVSVEPQGRYCLVANYETGSLCVLPVWEDGSLGEATETVQFSGSGPNPDRQEGPHAHMVVPGPEGWRHQGRIVLAIDLGADRLMTFWLDAEQGKLVPAHPAWTPLTPGSGPRHLAFHPIRPFAYVIGELDSTVTVFRYTSETGAFETLQTVSTLPAGYSGPNLGAEIKVAPSGRFVYASNRGSDSLAIFAVNEETGELALVGHEPTQGQGPRDFAIDPSGNWLLVANQDSGTVVTFRIDQSPGPGTPGAGSGAAAGTLHATGHVAAIPTPVCLHLVRQAP